MTSINKNTLITVTREQSFDEEVTVTGQNIKSVICTFLGDPESNISISYSSSSNFDFNINSFSERVLQTAVSRGPYLLLRERFNGRMLADLNNDDRVTSADALVALKYQQGRTDYPIEQQLYIRDFFIPTILSDVDKYSTIYGSATYPANVANDLIIAKETESLNTLPNIFKVKIKGNYTNQYKDQIIYVEKGSSANLELGANFLKEQNLAFVVTSVSDVPSGKDLLNFEQDVRNGLQVTYKIFVDDDSGETEYTLSQTINNDFSFGTNFLKSYFPPIPGEVPPKFKVTDYVIYESGKNYFVGNTFTVPGGTGNSAIISVSNVNANGNVLNISIDYSGSYSEAPTITYQYHSNTGSNLVIGLVMGVE